MLVIINPAVYHALIIMKFGSGSIYKHAFHLISLLKKNEGPMEIKLDSNHIVSTMVAAARISSRKRLNFRPEINQTQMPYR